MDNETIKEFIDEIDKVCRKYGLSITPEDSQGGFIIEKYHGQNIETLKDAQVFLNPTCEV